MEATMCGGMAGMNGMATGGVMSDDDDDDDDDDEDEDDAMVAVGCRGGIMKGS
jgi:hypothetical protein